MADQTYFQACDGTAKGTAMDICYKEYIFDPEHRSASPGFAEGLFTSASELLPIEALPWQELEQELNLENEMSILMGGGLMMEPEIDFTITDQIASRLKDADPGSGARYRNRATTMLVEWDEVAPKPTQPGPPKDPTPTVSTYHSTCRRSSSTPILERDRSGATSRTFPGSRDEFSEHSKSSKTRKTNCDSLAVGSKIGPHFHSVDGTLRSVVHSICSPDTVSRS